MRFPIARFCSLFGVALAMALTPAFAGAPQEWLTDSGKIDRFEFFRNGLYYWHGGGLCGGGPIPSSYETMRLVNYRPASPPQIVQIGRSCQLMGNGTAVWSDPRVVRDDSYVYYFKIGTGQQGRIYRRPVYSTDATAGTDLPTAITVPANQFHSPLALYNGKLYWTEINAGQNRTSIFSANVDGSGRAEEYYQTGQTQIANLVVGDYLDTAIPPASHPAIFFTDGNGNLYRHTLTDQTNYQYLSDQVYDVQLQKLTDGTTRVICLKHNVPGSPPYGAKALSAAALPDPGAYVMSIHPHTAAQTILYVTATGMVTSAGWDATRVYWTEMNGTAAPYQVDIYRRQVAPLTGAEIISTFEAGSRCDNIRSDGSTLHFIVDDTKIMRLGASSAAQQLDFQADAVEAVQTGQRLDGNTTPLVAGKATGVRGYAHIAANQTARSTYRCTADLRVSRNGSLLGTLRSQNTPVLTATSVLQNPQGLDIRANRDNGFNWQLPADWIGSGELQLQMTILPQIGALRETGALTNTVSRNFPVRTRIRPCLVFVPVRVNNLSNVNTSQVPQFGAMIQRAVSLLPVPGVRIYEQSSDVACPVVQLNPFASGFPWYFRGFNMGNQDSWALARVAMRDLLSINPFGCSQTIYCGFTNPNTTGFNGIGLFPIPCLSNLTHAQRDLVFTPRIQNTEPFNQPYGGRTLAHEMGHTYGLFHVHNPTSCGADPGWPFYLYYPYDPCRFGNGTSTGNWGYDPVTGTVIDPTTSGDLMSYGTTRWTSDYTWNMLLNSPLGPSTFHKNADTVEVLSQKAKAGSLPDQMLVSGQVFFKEGRAEFLQFYRLPADAAPAEKFAGELQPLRKRAVIDDRYYFEQYDGSGTVLASDEITSGMLNGGVESDSVFNFCQYVAFHPDTVVVRLVQNDVILAERAVSAFAPTVQITRFEVDEPGQTIRLAWTAEDKDIDLENPPFDPLAFAVLFSDDDGATWKALVNEWPDYGIEIDTKKLHGTTQGRIRVIATDWLLTGMDTTDAFTLNRHAPEVSISGLIEGQRVPFGTDFSLTGLATDAEDGSLDDANVWWTFFGPLVGVKMGVSELPFVNPPPGTYQVGFGGRDSDGQEATTFLNFEVLPPLIPNWATAPTIDGETGDPAWLFGTKILIPVDATRSIEARLVHSDSSLYVLIQGLNYASGSSSAAFTGIRIDANASGDGVAQGNDYGFFVDEWGNTSQQMGNGAGGMPVMDTPLPGFAAAVERHEGSWIAELQIPDSLIGGWDHAARIKLGEYWITYTGDDRNWPPLATYASPQTWAPIWFGTAPPAPYNRAPVANAGADQNWALSDVSIPLGLDASASFDSDGDPLDFNWTQTDGPTVTLSNSKTPLAEFTPPMPADITVYTFQVEVSDGTESDIDEVSVRVYPAFRDPVPPPDVTPTATQTPAPTDVATETPTETATETPSPTPSPTPVTHEVNVCANLTEPFPIPDPGETSLDLTVGESGIIDRVTVTLSIEHTYVSDVQVILQHVDSGRACVLFQLTSACSGDNIDVVFDDDSPWLLSDYCGDPNVVPVVNGWVHPYESLSAFQGDDAAGTWRLLLSDSTSPDPGVLTGVCVTLHVQGEAPTPSESPTPSQTPAPTDTETPSPSPTAPPTPVTHEVPVCGYFDSPRTIIDGASNDFYLNFPDTGIVHKITVSLSIDHPYVSQLNISLRHVESGFACPLFQMPTDCSGDDIDVLFDDDSPWKPGDFCGDPSVDPVVSGWVHPTGQLLVFKGANAAGDWVLTINDTAAGEVGYLTGVCVNLTLLGEAPTPTPSPTAASPTPSPSKTPLATDVPSPTATIPPTKTPSPSPTATPTPSWTPFPTPAPSATPGQIADTDHDGWADEYESTKGGDPNDPKKFPLHHDMNGDGKVTMLDVLILYRTLRDKEPLPNGAIPVDLDLDGDGLLTLEDALILFRWVSGQPGYAIIPIAG